MSDKVTISDKKEIKKAPAKKAAFDNSGLPVVEVSPHLKSSGTTKSIMWSVSAALMPAAVWGVYSFGWRSLLILFLGIFAAVAAEGVINFVTKKPTIQDGSAFLTGLLVSFNMPPGVAWYVPVVASLFAILIVKWAFGGLGKNWMNPALAGRVMVFFSYESMGKGGWTRPKLLPQMADVVSSATPLGYVKANNSVGMDSMEFLNQAGYTHSSWDTTFTDTWNRIFSADIDYGYFDAFFGNIPGCIGEISVFLLLLGSIYLFARKIITWQIPVAYLGSFMLFIWIFGGTQSGAGFFAGDPMFHVLTGGVVLAALYMATDMVTSPMTGKGMFIYGIGLGFFTFFIRIFGTFPEGASLAVLFMNMLVMLINRMTMPKKFGYVGRRKAK